MYLARKESSPNRYEFVLRESYRRGECFVCRDVISLGQDPGDYLVYSGGNSFYIDEQLIQHLRSQGITTPYAELEDLFPLCGCGYPLSSGTLSSEVPLPQLETRG